MNWRAIRTIAVKDLKEVQQNRGAWLPATVVPLLFMVLLPVGVIVVPSLFNTGSQPIFSGDAFGWLKDRLPPFVERQIAGLADNQALIVLITGYMLAPFLLIMPLMFASIVGAESFAGEKERKTIEALLYTPATDAELFVGKLAASVVPAVLLGWLAFVVYTIVVDAVGWPTMHRIWFPTATWWPLMLWLVPAFATLGMAATVLISARVNTFMEAYQLTGSLVVIVLALVAGQVSGVLFLSPLVVILLGVVVWLIDALLIWFGVRTFAREQLLARL